MSGNKFENEKLDVNAEVSKSAVEPVVMLHSYQSRQGCMICSKCGTAKHKTQYDGFKFWFAGVGYEQEPQCRNAT